MGPKKNRPKKKQTETSNDDGDQRGAVADLDEALVQPKDDVVADEELDSNEAATKKKRLRKRKRKPTSADDQDEAHANKDDDADHVTNATVNSSNAEKTAQVERTLYMEGLPFVATPSQVRQFLQTHYVQSSDAAANNSTDAIEDLRLPVWQDSGRLRGYGHVVFATVAAYQHALDVATSGERFYLQQRYITLQPAQRPKDGALSNAASSEPSTTISLFNLSYDATEADIEAALTDFVSSPLDLAPGGVRVVRHSATRHSKGLAYVTLTELDQAVAIVTQHAISALTILGRPCRMDYDHGRIRGSFRTADRTFWNKEYGKERTDE